LDMLDEALQALKTYDWGTDLATLKAIDDEIVTTHGDPSARGKLESRLLEILSSDVSRAAKDFVCRKLMVIGTAAAVPALQALLTHAELSHMARYALEGIPGNESNQAFREAVTKVDGVRRAGILSSLGSRGDAEAVIALTGQLTHEDPVIARAAALALGRIRSSEAAKALASVQPTDAQVKAATVDASLACAENLLASGKKQEALAIYKRLAGGEPAKHVRLAATRGMLACTSSGQSPTIR
jgi:HEAT repeat protein